MTGRFGLWSSLGMSVHWVDEVPPQLPAEPHLPREVSVRLIEESERARFDEVMAREHYLKNANAVGAVLRYVAEYRGQWVALLVFSSPAFHLKLRDQWLHWPAREVARHRHLIAQHARFPVLASPGQWPNLASRNLPNISIAVSAGACAAGLARANGGNATCRASARFGGCSKG